MEGCGPRGGIELPPLEKRGYGPVENAHLKRRPIEPAHRVNSEHAAA